MIHIIGDSHVKVFSGDDRLSLDIGKPSIYDKNKNIRTYHVGDCLAYSLGERENHRYQTIKSITDKIPVTDTILFVLGEIDVRMHLVKHDNALYCVARYITGVLELLRGHNKVYLYELHPILNLNFTDRFVSNRNFGTFEEIESKRKEFNRHLHFFTNKVFSINGELDKIPEEKKINYYLDFWGLYNHLNLDFYPIVVNELALNGMI
jgi:hypothetical protein